MCITMLNAPIKSILCISNDISLISSCLLWYYSSNFKEKNHTLQFFNKKHTISFFWISSTLSLHMFAFYNVEDVLPVGLCFYIILPEEELCPKVHCTWHLRILNCQSLNGSIHVKKTLFQKVHVTWNLRQIWFWNVKIL